MSNFHILTQSERNKSINIIFHLPIPSGGTNSASISWREAIVLEQGGADEIASVLPGISPAEISDLKAGVILEQPDTFKFSQPNLPNATKLAEIKARFAMLESEMVAEKQKTLQFMGYEGDV